LNEDPTEQNNLSSSHPQQLNDLKKALYNLDQQMIEPLWPNLVEIPIAVDYTVNARPQEDHETIIWAN
jgi:uncharacterized sulfatase